MFSKLPRRLILPVVAGVLVMAACDDDDDNVTNPPPPPPTTETASATLASLNGSAASGTATFSLTGDVLVARVELAGADTGTMIMQHVHEGGACPTTAADTNSDGFIDALEAAAVTGLILVPLDADVSTQAGGSGAFPISDTTGAYVYADTVSFTTFHDDLLDTDPDPNDQVGKLSGDSIDIDTRVVEVHGVADTVALPSTVLALPGLTAQQSLPIACGTID